MRMTIDKTGMLQECDIHFEILQEFHEGGHGGRVHLGNVKLNLAEYTRLPDISPSERDPQPEDDGYDDGSITRRYLLQDSKVNSTLKIGIKMRQTEGDMNFTAPPLKAAMVVGGIAGVLTTEAGEGDDIPSITSKTRELSEAQDIYRRTLAATWACQAGEMAPDKLIENLFAGGDGGRPPQSPTSSKDIKSTLHHHARLNSRDDPTHSGSSSDETKPHSSFVPRSSLLTPQMATTATTSNGNLTPYSQNGHRRGRSRDSPNLPSTPGLSSTMTMPTPSVSGRASIDQQIQHSQQEHVSRRQRATVQEYTEFDLRDDLKSWSVRVK